MYSRTGGWPAGLRLAAAFVSERGWQQLGEFQGGGAELYAYFNTEVLRRASRRDQNTILRWSLLDRIEDDVEVTAGGASRELLASLEQAGLVVRDSADGGHRFQPLYAEFLHSRARALLPAAETVELHRGPAARAAPRASHAPSRGRHRHFAISVVHAKHCCRRTRRSVSSEKESRPRARGCGTSSADRTPTWARSRRPRARISRPRRSSGSLPIGPASSPRLSPSRSCITFSASSMPRNGPICVRWRSSKRTPTSRPSVGPRADSSTCARAAVTRRRPSIRSARRSRSPARTIFGSRRRRCARPS